MLRVMCDTIGVLFRESRDPADPSYLGFIDWVKGTRNPVSILISYLSHILWIADAIVQMSELAMSPNAWCFLSPEHILLPHRDRSSRYCVAMCKISPEQENGLKFLALFHFPDEAVYNPSRSHVSLFSDPSPGMCPPGRPFFLDPERIVKIEWLVMNFNRRLDWVEIYIPARAFLSWADTTTGPLIAPPQLAHSLSTDSITTLLSESVSVATLSEELASEEEQQPHGEKEWFGVDGMRHVSWEAWGPDNSRMMFKTGADNEFQCFMFGTRAVSFSASSKITVRTFGGGRSSWGSTIDTARLDRMEEWSGGDVRERGSLDDDAMDHWFSGSEASTAVFQQFGSLPPRRFKSYLPHHLARRGIGFTLRGVYPHGVMCDDEHIILVEVSSHPILRSYHH